MANDRMWLVNRVTGVIVFLAKHDGVLWHRFHEDVGERIANAFDESETELELGYGGQHAWCVMYEHGEPDIAVWQKQFKEEQSNG